MESIGFPLVFELLSYSNPKLFYTISWLSRTMRGKIENQVDYLLFLVNSFYKTKYVQLSQDELCQLVKDKNAEPHSIYSLLSSGMLQIHNVITGTVTSRLLMDKTVCRTGSVWIMYDNRLIVTGGIHRKDSDMNRAYRIDPLLWTIVRLPDMIYSHNSHAMAVDTNGNHAYAIGGVSPYIMR
jgi:hypothetical protein